MDKNNLLRLIRGGAVFCGIVFVLSLFYYFRPFTADDVLQTISLAASSIEEFCQQFQQEDSPENTSQELAAAESESSEPSTDSALALSEDSDSSSLSAATGSIVPASSRANRQTAPEPNPYAVTLDTSAGSMLYYNQGDSRWADYPYGGSDPMRQYGCGPTAAAMLINSFARSQDAPEVTPPQLADWSSANGFYAPHGGSYHGLIQAAARAYGLKAESVPNRTYEQAASLLSSGHILAALMGRGTFTDKGHFILITKLLDNGHVTIADPNSYENTMKEWDLNQILSELKRSYDSGGPLWAVSSPSGS